MIGFDYCLGACVRNETFSKLFQTKYEMIPHKKGTWKIYALFQVEIFQIKHISNVASHELRYLFEKPL